MMALDNDGDGKYVGAIGIDFWGWQTAMYSFSSITGFVVQK